MYLHVLARRVNGTLDNYSSRLFWKLQLLGLGAAVFVLAADAYDQADEREEHGDDDAADNHGQKHDHDWLEQRGHGRDGVIDFVVVIVSDLHEHLRQSAGLLADIDHADDHGRENI